MSLFVLLFAAFLPGQSVAFVGDSITAGYYPEIVAKEMHIPLVRYAVQGARIKRISKLLDKALAKNPTYVVLYVGLNDCAEVRSDYRVVYERLLTLVRHVWMAGSEPIVVRHHGWFGSPRQFHGASCSYMVNSLMEDRLDVRQVDTRWLSDDEDALLKEYDAGDGLHLNYRGHKKLAERVLAELRRAITRPTGTYYADAVSRISLDRSSARHRRDRCSLTTAVATTRRQHTPPRSTPKTS